MIRIRLRLQQTSLTIKITAMPTKSDLAVPPFYETYIKAIHEEDLMEALKNSSRRFRKLLKNMPKNKIDYAYEPGKWTVREMLQHVIDTERVFSFRALWFARHDSAPLPGFDEKKWAQSTSAAKREWKELVREFRTVRRATEQLFASFGEEQLLSTGVASNNTLSVAAWGFICAGHVAHHTVILKERYLAKK